MSDSTRERPSPAGELLEQLQQVIDEPTSLESLDRADWVIEQLPAQAFVTVARQLHDEHRLDLLLPHATPEQLTSLLDIDAWDDDRVVIPRARMWLTAIADAYGDVRSRGSLSELIYRMDPEMWTFALSPGTAVIDLDPQDDGARDEAHAELSHLRTWDTPDGFFVVGVPDDDQGRMTLHTLNHVYGDDLTEGRKLVLSIQSALAAEIEEDLLRWRSGRLADLGFVPREEAMKLFRPFDRHTAADAEPRDFRYLPDEHETGASLQTWSSSELLKRVMARLSDPEHGLRAREFLLLVNEVMAAQRFPPGHERLQERAIDQTQSTISLGLELLLTTRSEHPDPEAFLADRIQAIGLRDVFRVGYGALSKLRRAASTLHQSTRISLTSPGSLLDRPWGPTIAALMNWYPELPLLDKGRGTRPLRTFADVSRATELVGGAGALAALAFDPAGYGIDPVWITRVDEPEKLVLGDLVRSAIVHAQLPGTTGTMSPLTPDDLHWARQNLLDASELAPVAARDFSARCDALGLGEHGQVLAQNLLTRLRIELLGLEYDAQGLPDLTRAGGFVTIQDISMWLQTGTGTRAN